MIKCENNKIFKLFLIQIIMLFFMPAMGKAPLAPEPGLVMAVYKGIMYVIYGGISVWIVFLFLKQKTTINRKYIWWVVGFFALCTMAGIWGLIRGVPITDIIRGFLPFAWYIYIIVIVETLTSKLDKVLLLLAGISVLYALRIFVYYIIYCFGKSDVRVSFYFPKANGFMFILGVILLLYLFIARTSQNKIFYIGMIICFIAVLLVEAKASLIAALAGALLFVILAVISMFIKRKNSSDREKRKSILIKGIIGIITLLTVTVIIFSGTSLSKRWKNAVTISRVDTNKEKTGSKGKAEGKEKIQVKVDEGSVGVRIIEYRTAYSLWKQSPILGQGLGYRWSAPGLDYGGPVIYMHNIIAYSLIDFGLIGILFLGSIIVSLIIMLIKALRIKNVYTAEKLKFFLYVSGIGSAFIYANLTAIFRDLEFVILFAVLISGAICEYSRLKEEI